MIISLALPSRHKALTPFQWNDIPSLVVIAGANGAGKTELIKLIDHWGQDLAFNLKVNANLKLKNLQGKIFYVPVGYSPERITPKADQDPRHQSEIHATQIIRYIRNAQWRQPHFNQVAYETLLKAGLSGTELSNIPIDDIKNLSDSDLAESLPKDFYMAIRASEDNTFIAEVCVTYFEALSAFKVKNYGATKTLSDHEIYIRLGSEPPWIVINQLFLKYGFNYKLSPPVSGIRYVPNFIDTSTGVRVDFANLSSGEKILVTFILWAFNSRQKLHKEIFLLDEIDAHLNPSLSKMMMEIINDKLVGEYGLQVILTTHSPSTIAHTPDKNIFWMERGSPIRPSTKSEVIPLLSDGFITVQPNKALDIFGMVMRDETKPIICVEGITDKEILSEAWQRLYNSTTVPFAIFDVFDCYFLTNLFKRGDIFNNYPDHTFIGLLDFDDALINARQKLKPPTWKQHIDEKNGILTFKHKTEKGSLLTLPVPDFRKDYASPAIKNSYLSIELLFEDAIINEYCTTFKVAGGAELNRFNDKKKTAFAAAVKGLDDKDFQAFAPLFENLLAMFE